MSRFERGSLVTLYSELNMNTNETPLNDEFGEFVCYSAKPNTCDLKIRLNSRCRIHNDKTARRVKIYNIYRLRSIVSRHLKL
jgi:hypothetical protein